MNESVAEDLLKKVEEVLDWWEFNGSPILGDVLMDELSLFVNDFKKEMKCLNHQKNQ